METLGSFSLSDLLRLSRPVTGTASLNPTSSPPLKRIKLDQNLLLNPNPSRKSFTPISLPVLLVGTVNFFSEASSHRTGSCLNHCLSFSDSSATICCYIVDFDPRVIGQEIHVMAWNYLPIKQGEGQGVLEIIQWRFSSPDTAPLRDFSLSLESAQDSGVKASSFAFGLVKSVSLTFTLPIENGKTGEMGDSVGFLAEFLTCMCDKCAKMRPSNEKSGLHRFTESKVVYFIRPTHKWRPVVAKLVGKVMYLWGLKKRLVVVGKESYVMLVSTIKTKVSLCDSVVSDLPTDHSKRGAYRGIVTGIYLHGAVIESDKKVWLLIHDTLLVPHHSLRIGATVSVRDFHFVHANFAWTKVIIVGTCVMTSFCIDSFAVSDTKVLVKTEEKSALGTFVESLNLSAKFWVLLSVSCFKYKFRAVLSDKELLGSINSAGLVQTYSSQSLPPDVFRPHNSMFMAYCNHDQCTYSSGHDQSKCKLIVPLSNFVGRCEELWISIQSEMSESYEVHCNNTCDGISYPGYRRRIIPSDDFGCILMGNIQACSSSGRLQLVDATGNIDVVIPDLPSDLSVQTIYEVKDYKVVLEGFGIEGDNSMYEFGEPLSCHAIFKRQTYRKRIHGLMLYVQFYLKDSVCLASPSRAPSNLPHSENHGLNHLLVISHKFPLTNKFPFNSAMSICSSLFAEALIFPCKFKRSENGELIQLGKFQDALDFSKRDHKKASEKGPWLAPCSLASRNGGVSATTLCQFNVDSSNYMVSKSLARILLEFKCENFFSYQMLRIGGYYFLNCSEGFNPTRVCKCWEKGGSFVVTGNTLQSLSLSFSDDVNQKEPSGTSSDELVLLKSLSELHEIVDLKSVSQGITKLLPPSQVFSVSSCLQHMFHQNRNLYGSTDLGEQRLAQGDLISVCGDVEYFHDNDCDSVSLTASKCLKIPNPRGNNICIHLADDNQMVVIRGNLSRKLFPIGFGVGASATFHRLLLTCSSNRKEKLLLTPVTYIEITSVRKVKTNRGPNQQMFKVDSLIESLCHLPPLGLFSDLHNKDSKVTRFCCRILTLNVLVLESCMIGSSPAYKIPLAGFVLDDGSALCNCWTDNDLASTLLSLRDICSSFFSSDFSSLERAPKRLLASGLCHCSDDYSNYKNTVGYYLDHMLKKHHKVIVKNHGVSLDICQDLLFHSGSGKVFSILEERLLNYIILSSCHGPTFIATGLVMDASATKQFDAYISESAVLRGCMQNIWIREVACVDPLKDAFNLILDLKNG
ncbi:conserved telomere maintenance component 1 [Rhynchospora pubera]|uniref:CST complex subunit CTC1 n=1 Tax=Rhynchospora pubera TaxID=906938 RepID=A0AAV8G4Z0_9POAL|nr:conserved telomere maintenance component 1 [Rhynchospora pubera]